MRHILVSGLAAILLQALAHAQTPSIAPSEPPVERGGWFTYGIQSDLTSLNPYLQNDMYSTLMTQFMFNALLRYDDHLELQGDLADRWTTSSDGKEVGFWLRAGVRFHDGVELTADDVEFTLNYIKNPRLRTTRRSCIQGLAPDPKAKDHILFRKLGKYQFAVSYSEPSCSAISRWAQIPILPKHVLENQDPNDNAYSLDRAQPVGTGPFAFERHTTDELLVLRSNDLYFKGRPYLDKIVFRVVPKAETLLAKLEAREIDYGDVNLSQTKLLSSLSGSHNVFQWQDFVYSYVAWNCDPKHSDTLSDVRVRRALCYGTNTAKLIRQTAFGKAAASAGIFPPASWAASPRAKAYPYDPDRARMLLKEAGWDTSAADGVLRKGDRRLEFTLRFSPSSHMISDRVSLIKADLAKIGVSCNLEATEWTVLQKNFVATRTFDAVYMNRISGFEPDPFPEWHSESIPLTVDEFLSGKSPDIVRQARDMVSIVDAAQDGPARDALVGDLAKLISGTRSSVLRMLDQRYGLNRCAYRNADVDRLIADAQSNCARDVRRADYNEIQEIILGDAPYTFLFVPQSFAVCDKRVRWYRGVVEQQGYDRDISSAVVRLPPTGVWTEDFVLKSWIPASDRNESERRSVER